MQPDHKILVIDDEEVVLDSCAQILEGGKYELATAADGASGLRLVREFRPDVVFVDLKMPGVSGFEVLQETQAMDASVVTIVITGYATVSSAVEAMAKGAYDFLPKPFTPDEFRLITQRGLEKRRLVLETIALKREREMLREHFAAIVSHELKAPLGAVQQNLYALTLELSTVLTEAQKARFERMKASLDNLLKLIQTWLRLYSTDIEGLAESFKATDVPPVIARAVEGLQPHAARKDLDLVTSLHEPLGVVQGDEGALTEALVNIIGNAIKYSRPGGRVLVKAEQEDGSILISVTDTGVGIAREDLPFIFDGVHVGSPGPAAERGSGLGLAITRRIIEAHHGSMSVDSELGKGSTFVIRLPTLNAGVNGEPGRPAEVVAASEEGGTP